MPRVEAIEQVPRWPEVKSQDYQASLRQLTDLLSEAEKKGDASSGEGGIKWPQDKLKEHLSKAVEKLNKTMELYHTELRFTVHEESGEMMVKIINSETREVIREIPPEKVLNFVAYFKHLLGLMIDKFI